MVKWQEVNCSVLVGYMGESQEGLEMMVEDRYLRFKVSHGNFFKDVFPCITPLP
jgi:hypothetical protein